MVEIRSKRNAVKIEKWRLSRVPVATDADIYQGDLMVWDTDLGYAVPFTVAASGAKFIGVSEQSTKVPTLGVLTSDQQVPRITVLQEGLVEVIANANATIKPFDSVYGVAGAPQNVAFSGSNAIGFVDPGFVGGASKAVLAGDLIKIWLTVPAAFKS